MSDLLSLGPMLVGKYRASLEAQVDWYQRLLVFWTKIVVFGILLELWEELFGPLVEHLAKRPALHREWRAWRKRIPVWKHWYTGIGVVLVLAGVAGELYIEGVLSSPQDKLRDLNKDLVISTQKDAADADERASVADRDAGIANERAGVANRAAKQAGLHAATLKLQTEQLRAANLELENDLSPRLFKEQESAVKSLREFPGTKARLEYLLDAEAKRTAEQIAFVLDRAGWLAIPIPATPADENRINTETDFFDGVTVSIGFSKEDDDFTDRRTKRLLDILNATGIQAFPAPRPPFTPVVVIRVGLKPSPALGRIARERENRSVGPGFLHSAGRRLPLPSTRNPP